MKKIAMLAPVLAVLLGSPAAWALSCQARQGQALFEGVQADDSDIQITLKDGRFVWIGLVGQETMTVDLMRPATRAEMEGASQNGDKDPPTAAGMAHADASLAKLSSGVRIGGYLVTCGDSARR